METTIRPARATDAAECGRIIYAAFTDIADRHGFSRPFPSPEVATGLATMRLTNPGFYGVVAEEAGNIVGSNFVYLRSPVAGISPITVDPSAQNRRIGRTLMQAVMITQRHRESPPSALCRRPTITARCASTRRLAFKQRHHYR